MSKLAVETIYGSLSTYVYPAGYDQTKLGLGPLMKQDSSGWVGPYPVAIARPNEQSTAIPSVYPWAMQWSSTEDWIFLIDNAAITTNRRVNHYTYSRTTNTFTWKGFITANMVGTGNHTVRGFRMTYDLYTTGTVGVSGTAVTGDTTAWSTSRLAVGSRIGFGSTDPTQIVTWYEISAVGSDTSITLTASAGTVSSGTSYVIEELRAIIVTGSSNANQGGLQVVKGLRQETFTGGGTTISAAVSTDNVRAVYWLATAATALNQTATGCAVVPRESWTTHYLWVNDGTTTSIFYKYNLRAALTVASGKDTTSLVLATGTSASLVGTATQANNGRYAVLSHGSGSGLPCFYFTTSTRVYRSKDLTTIVASDSTHISGGDLMQEVPPGSANTMAASSLMASLEYSSMLDKFIIMVNATTTPFHSYVSNYRTDASQIDRRFLIDTRQINQIAVDSSTTPHPTLIGGSFSCWSEAGICYLAGIGTTSLINLLYAIPLSADWEYASTTNCRIVTPSISTPNCDKYVRVYTNNVEVLGGVTTYNLGIGPEPFRTYYRTTGISDNTGSWTLLGDSNDLSGVSGASAIQFMYEFRTIGLECIPARLQSTCVVYNDLSTDSHYQPSATNSDKTNKRFAWRFSTAFGSSVPSLRVRLYDAVAGTPLVDDNTGTPSGTFEKSTDGGSNWVAWTNADKGNDTTYLRYTPASLADNIRVRALLTLL